MATRDNQTLQIALMVFCVITVLMAILSYFLYDSMEKTKADREKISDQLQNSKTDFSQLQEERDFLKTILGVNIDSTKDEIKTVFSDDMETIGKDFPDDQRNYRNIVSFINTTIKAAREKANNQATSSKEFQAKIKQLEQTHGEQIAELQKQLNQAQKTLAAEQSKFDDDRQKLTQDFEAKAKLVEELRTKVSAREDELGEKIADLASTNEKLLADLVRSRKNQDSQGPRFENPDGRVVRSNTRNGAFVWLNLGSADGVTVGQAFSVHSPGENVAGDEQSKASIEVTRIIEPHLSEARVTRDEPTYPILSGDAIFSPIWQKGAQLHFALAGNLDLDGDGKLDFEQFKRLVELNGGVVDSWIDVQDQSASRTGNLGVDTRYLVYRDFDEIRGYDLAATEVRKLSEDMKTDATKLGIPLIGFDRFLDMMGWHRGARTVTLGSGARGEDFPLKPERGSVFTPGPFTQEPGRTKE